MGSTVSPTLANLTLYPLEQEFLKLTKHIINYWRYIDDYIIIFKGEKHELEKSTEYLNTMHPTIKSTHHQLFQVSSKESFYESSGTQVMKKMR